MTRTERQNLAIEKWKQAGGKNTLVMATGCGKTRTAIMTIQRVLNKAPTCKVVVVVPTIVLKDQWKRELSKFRIKNVNVLVLNTAASCTFKCNFLVIDECHKAAADQMSKVFENCTPQLIMGLTATYERLDGKEREILDKYCPVCDTITVEEATQNGWLSPYIEYKVLLEVDLTEYEKANREFMSHFSFFNFEFDTAMDCVTNIFAQQKYAKRMNCEWSEVKAHAYSWNRALRFRKTFVANHPKKLEIAKQILKARPNSKAITFNSSIKQCEAYGFGYVVHSKKGKKKNQMTLEEFAQKGKGTVIHSSKMLIEGLDCPGLDLAIITGFNSSKTNKIQEIGRTIRLEPGKRAEIFTLVIKGTVENNWYAKSMEGMSYVELNEKELQDILNGKNLINKTKQLQEKDYGNRY